jgi:hypothetical protein
MMNIDSLYESLVYRGVGAGSNSRTIRWVTPSKNIAAQYAMSRGGVAGGRMVELEFNPKHTADLGHDRLRLNASRFIAVVSRNAKNKSKDVIPYLNRFREYFGEESRPIITFWESENNKRETATLLKAMGYDSIKIEEAGNITYGILR